MKFAKNELLNIRPANEDDVSLLAEFIRGLAEYEKLSDEMVADEAILRESFFGSRPSAEALIAEWEGKPAAFFENFSTFKGRSGLYLEDIYVEPEAVEVTDEMLEDQLDNLRRRFATLIPVERSVQWGDILTADVSAVVEDQTFAEDKDVVFPLVEGRQLFLPELAEVFVDMKVGDEKKVDIAVPEDFVQEGFRGKTANFTINIKEIKESVVTVYPDKKFTILFYKKSTEIYDWGVGVTYKSNDKKYKIHGVQGRTGFGNIDDCYRKQDEVEKEISSMFKETKKKNWGILKYEDYSEGSKYKPITFDFNDGATLMINCYYYHDDPPHMLKISMTSKELSEYLTSPAKPANSD